MEEAKAAEDETLLTRPTPEKIRAFSELTRSCDGLWTASS
jgi:hypothetical protein